MKKSNRIKIQLPNIRTREEAESVMTDLAHIITAQRRIISDRDAAVLAINRNVEGPLAECDAAIAAKTDALRVWAETNPDQFPKGRKSLELTSGVLGFRTGTPKLALLSRAWNWDKVLEKLRTMASRFIRTKEEVDKDAILGEYSALPDKDDANDMLAPWGIKVTQDESFFVDPAVTELPSRQISEAA